MHFENPNRPWPVPCRPYAIAMRWHELLFMHWRVEASLLRPLVPRSLEIETFDGSAWIGVIPFRMSSTRPRFVPAVPGLANFPELNVRTYVTAEGKPGVWFFTLDAAKWIAVQTARRFFNLNYCHARMRSERGAQGTVSYRSDRVHRGMRPASFAARYRPTGAPSNPMPGTLEHFVTERYCLYAASKDGRTYRGDIFHEPWSLQPAEAEIERNTMIESLRLPQPTGEPVLHYAEQMPVVAWRLEALKGS